MCAANNTVTIEFTRLSVYFCCIANAEMKATEARHDCDRKTFFW